LENKLLFYNNLFFENVPKMCLNVPKILGWLISWFSNVPKMCLNVPKPQNGAFWAGFWLVLSWFLAGFWLVF